MISAVNCYVVIMGKYCNNKKKKQGNGTIDGCDSCLRRAESAVVHKNRIVDDE